jgi:hypothetical protein
VQPAPGALLYLALVEFAAQRLDLRAAPGVGVGVAGGGGRAPAVDTDQRRGERVQRDAGDPAPQRRHGQAGDDLGELVDHLVRVDLAGAVRTGAERVGDLAPPACHRPARGVVDVAPARGRADVERQDERVQRVVELDTTVLTAFSSRSLTPGDEDADATDREPDAQRGSALAPDPADLGDVGLLPAEDRLRAAVLTLAVVPVGDRPVLVSTSLDDSTACGTWRCTRTADP